MVAFGYSAGAFCVQHAPHAIEDIGDCRVIVDVVPSVVGFDGVGVEVIELPLVGQRVASIGVWARPAAGGEVTQPGSVHVAGSSNTRTSFHKVPSRRWTSPSKFDATCAGVLIRSGSGGLVVRLSRRATPEAPVSPSSMLSFVIR